MINILLLAIILATVAILFDIDSAKCSIIKAIRESSSSGDQEKIKQVLSIVEANKAKMQKAVDDNK